MYVAFFWLGRPLFAAKAWNGNLSFTVIPMNAFHMTNTFMPLTYHAKQNEEEKLSIYAKHCRNSTLAWLDFAELVNSFLNRVCNLHYVSI